MDNKNDNVRFSEEYPKMQPVSKTEQKTTPELCKLSLCESVTTNISDKLLTLIQSDTNL